MGLHNPLVSYYNGTFRFSRSRLIDAPRVLNRKRSGVGGYWRGWRLRTKLATEFFSFGVFSYYGKEQGLCQRLKRHLTQRKDVKRITYMCGDLGINSKTPNRILTRRLPDTKCINVSPRIRLHASIRLKIKKKRKIIKSKVANGKRSRQN